MSAPWCSHTKGPGAQYCCIRCLKCGICCSCPAYADGKLPTLVSSIGKQVADRERELRRANITEVQPDTSI